MDMGDFGTQEYVDSRTQEPIYLLEAKSLYGLSMQAMLFNEEGHHGEFSFTQSPFIQEIDVYYKYKIFWAVF